MSQPFRGVINMDVRDSVPDWEPFQPPKARADAPNVLYVIWDDTGIAAWDVFGGRIKMPTLSRIAELGLRYTNWHTTALCSPTRSSLLTGRNAHSNGMACIVEGAAGYPGQSAVIPPENGTIAETLLEEGYNTYCVGKWHLTPESESNMSSSRRTWPLGRGFERYYGFLGGETNQWFPDLVYDNHAVDQPAKPDDGYHLSADLVDKAIEFIRDGKQVAPEKPWFTYLAFGANHAPHHAPIEWSDRYKGVFDDGYELYREGALARQKELGIVPPDTEMAPINPWPAPEVIAEADEVRPWDELSDDEKQLFVRMAEVYAGFSSYTDHELGRLLDYLEQSGQLDDTIIVVCSDNGASGEGSPNGSVNENKFFNSWPDDLQENLAKVDQLGGPETYNHYPTGWAVAFNTPYKMFKRYTLEGGIADPLIIAWPNRMRDVAGQNRDQYHHAIDIVPTIYSCLGITPPEYVKGYPQVPIQGESIEYTFADQTAASRRRTQYYEMLGSRALYHDGWKLVAQHGPLSGVGHFGQDVWELYHTETDRAEMHDVADQYPDRVQEMVGMWFAIAGRNNVFPLDDRTARERLVEERPSGSAPRTAYTYYPGTAEIPEGVAPNIRNRSYTLRAVIDVTDQDASGIVLAQGSRFGGHALYLADGKLRYVYNFLGIDETTAAAETTVPLGTTTIEVAFDKEHEEPQGVANGTVTVRVDGDDVASAMLRTQPGKFALAGEGLAVGRDSADPVSQAYGADFPTHGFTIDHVTVDVAGDHYVNEEIEARGMLARE
ncbi:arylsulfatase [Curtobacterium sp. PhB130]|uniref:sulfatase-like hydrolase/transferase n=1 Tax=unclassified Curtobacterium TaxID=257496 RepID=UPI000F4CD064|nr:MULTISPECIES: sulfatase-like hydrolase/transferase [unclassified Curtobacterium]ROS75183.1 arylsulfatase [Curtobacterium sp. PhB130]TCK63808.1 arylsulfatase [Curtobacterium sp. PhB136]